MTTNRWSPWEENHCPPYRHELPMLPILRRAFFIAVMLFANGAWAAPLKIPDVAVTDQDGRRAHFYSGLVHGRTVVVNFIFTRCTTICGTMGANFGRLQRIVGHDVELIS